MSPAQHISRHYPRNIENKDHNMKFTVSYAIDPSIYSYRFASVEYQKGILPCVSPPEPLLLNTTKYLLITNPLLTIRLFAHVTV